MEALLLDTETTGLIDNLTLKITRQPHLTEYYGCVADIDTGEVRSEVHHMVKPPVAIPDDIERRTGITNDMVTGQPSFLFVAEEIRTQIEASPMVIAQNLSYDMEMLGIEFGRLGTKIAWPRKKICTVEQTVHLRGYRLNLSDLHEYLTGERFEGAHRAKNDVLAMLRCVVELRKRGML